jgi:hypothetical protein
MVGFLPAGGKRGGFAVFCHLTARVIFAPIRSAVIHSSVFIIDP